MLDTWYLRGRRVISIKKCLTNFIYWSHILDFFSYIIDLIWLSIARVETRMTSLFRAASRLRKLWWSCHFDLPLHNDHVTLIFFCTIFMPLLSASTKNIFIGLIPWNPPYVFIHCGVINKDPECALEYMMITMIKRN